MWPSVTYGRQLASGSCERVGHGLRICSNPGVAQSGLYYGRNRNGHQSNRYRLHNGETDTTRGRGFNLVAGKAKT